MQVILGFLSNVRLTLTQWLILSLSLAVGVLVVLFRQQGSRLHSAQISLLTQHMETQEQLANIKVDSARSRFNNALKAYNDAKE